MFEFNRFPEQLNFPNNDTKRTVWTKEGVDGLMKVVINGQGGTYNDKDTKRIVAAMKVSVLSCHGTFAVHKQSL